jgi:hypothetical protein
MRVRLLFPSCALVAACDAWTPDFLEEPERGCPVRRAFYPDADGDGVGSTASVYIGCEAPEGYVTVTGDCDDGDPTTTECPDSDTGPSGDGEGV